MSDHGKKKTRKDRIMEAALRIFAEKGFQNATISAISKEAGVSEATIYEYFGTKEDLLFSIPEKISKESQKEFQRILPYLPGVEERMRAILRGYINLYQSNPHYSALVLLQLMSNERFRQTAAHAAIRESAHSLLDCIREGIRTGVYREDANPYLIRSMLLGTIEHLFIHWHMRGRPKDMNIMDLLEPFVELVLSGLRTKKEETGITLQLKLEEAGALRDFLLQASGTAAPGRVSGQASNKIAGKESPGNPRLKSLHGMKSNQRESQDKTQIKTQINQIKTQIKKGASR